MQGEQRAIASNISLFRWDVIVLCIWATRLCTEDALCSVSNTLPITEGCGIDVVHGRTAGAPDTECSYRSIGFPCAGTHVFVISRRTVHARDPVACTAWDTLLRIIGIQIIPGSGDALFHVSPCSCRAHGAICTLVVRLFCPKLNNILPCLAEVCFFALQSVHIQPLVVQARAVLDALAPYLSPLASGTCCFLSTRVSKLKWDFTTIGQWIGILTCAFSIHLDFPGVQRLVEEKPPMLCEERSGRKLEVDGIQQCRKSREISHFHVPGCIQ